MFLPQFKWYDELRPKSPADIYDVSEDLKQLVQSIEGGTRRRSGSNANAATSTATDTGIGTETDTTATAVSEDSVNAVETATKPIE